MWESIGPEGASFKGCLWFVCRVRVQSEQETDLHHPVGGFLSREVAPGPSSPFAGVGSMGPFCLWLSQTVAKRTVALQC